MPINDALPEAFDGCIRTVWPALLLAPRDYLIEVCRRLDEAGVRQAVHDRDSEKLFDWIIRSLARQGISNHAAEVFLARNGSPTIEEISGLIATEARCPRLRCWWSFEGCGYRRSTGSCNTPHHRLGCPITLIPARKGALAEAAVGLWLFIRDVADGDLVDWIDRRLAAVDASLQGIRRLASMRAALLEPLVEIPGTGPKVWSMIMSELLLGADPERSTWIEVGASFVAIDSLVHAFLHRTGVLRRLGADHNYGRGCYGPDGCARVIERLASAIDARKFDLTFPACFPRWVQFAIWYFCAADGWAICNANKIDDQVGCDQQFCPAFHSCDRLPITS